MIEALLDLGERGGELGQRFGGHLVARHRRELVQGHALEHVELLVRGEAGKVGVERGLALFIGGDRGDRGIEREPGGGFGVPGVIRMLGGGRGGGGRLGEAGAASSTAAAKTSFFMNTGSSRASAPPDASGRSVARNMNRH